jgi:type IV secretion system protein VirB2
LIQTHYQKIHLMKKQTKQLIKLSLCASFLVAIAPVLTSSLGLAQAFAQSIADVTANATSNALTRVMCNALRIVQGSAGKTFAAFAIIAVGVGFFSGKVSWGLMIGVAAGIAAMFGAPSIVAAISGENTQMNCGSTL